MKIFKRIYYPVMAVLVVLMLTLGIVDARVGASGGKNGDAAYSYATAIANETHNGYRPAAQSAVRDMIVSTLTEAGATRVESEATDDDGKNLVDYATVGETAVPSVYVQKCVVTHEAQGDDATVSVAREVENVILSVPGTGANAILLYARYDGATVGGAADATATGALLAAATDVLKDAANGKTYANSVVFLFGDAGQEDDLGAHAFLHQFAGFGNIAAKVRAVADFRVGGTGGTLMLYGGNDNLNCIGKYASFNGGTFASSALELFMKRSNEDAFGAFGDYNTLHFTNRGGFNRYATASDTKVNKKLTKQQYNAMGKFVSGFANATGNLSSKSSAVYFSYLDVMTVYYPAAVAFVIAGVILGLVIAIVILNVRNKAFPWGKALAGAAVQLVTLLA
ncbi:MAG: M28 family peptidase, partial [Clostridiales bacterium]|nr:M28 family peptidase [Clostridiales bacterium]